MAGKWVDELLCKRGRDFISAAVECCWRDRFVGFYAEVSIRERDAGDTCALAEVSDRSDRCHVCRFEFGCDGVVGALERGEGADQPEIESYSLGNVG